MIPSSLLGGVHNEHAKRSNIDRSQDFLQRMTRQPQHHSLCSDACMLSYDHTYANSASSSSEAFPNSSNKPMDVSNKSKPSPCETFWCRYEQFSWGEHAASDARRMDPFNWNEFGSESETVNSAYNSTSRLDCSFSLHLFLLILLSIYLKLH